MPLTLDVCNEHLVEDPTDLQFRQAVLGLDLRKDSAFLTLGPSEDEATFIQASGDPPSGFSVEYQEGTPPKLFRAVNDLTADQLIAALISYRDGTPEWRAFSPWEPVEL